MLYLQKGVELGNILLFTTNSCSVRFDLKRA